MMKIVTNFVAKRLLIRWNWLWLSVLWCHSISLRVFKNFQNARMYRRQSYKNIQEWREREREEPMRNTTKVLPYLAFTKQWRSLRVRSTIGRVSGILSFTIDKFNISTTGWAEKRTISAIFLRSQRPVVELFRWLQMPQWLYHPNLKMMVSIFWHCFLLMLSAPTQSQTKWCMAVQKSKAIVHLWVPPFNARLHFPLSLVPIEIRLETITSTNEVMSEKYDLLYNLLWLEVRIVICHFFAFRFIASNSVLSRFGLRSTADGRRPCFMRVQAGNVHKVQGKDALSQWFLHNSHHIFGSSKFNGNSKM